MTAASIVQPDVTLTLDLEGVIRNVELAGDVGEARADGWVGRRWVETVSESASSVIARMIEDALARGLSAFHQVPQRFPSGRELPIEYTTIRLGENAGMLAIGRSIQAVTELRNRLAAAQQAMEQDYWRLREVETRYRVLFDVAQEPVLTVRATDLRVMEANPAAVRALGVNPVGRCMADEVAPADRERFLGMLQRSRDKGRAPGMMVHLGREARPWLARSSLISTADGPTYLLQMALVGGGPPLAPPVEPLAVERLVGRLPDGFVVVDGDGLIVWANDTFLDLAQIGAAQVAIGQPLGRWLGRPGADLPVLLSALRRYGMVRCFETALTGLLGTEIVVECTAGASAEGDPTQIGIVLREVTTRDGRRTNGRDVSLEALAGRVGHTPLRELVGETVATVERQSIEIALTLAGGNRTAAASLLRLSRQSLYAKLDRYGLDAGADGGEPVRDAEPHG
jgi:transcriptional regulator PpsR